LQLPACVKIILTSRPQVVVAFDAWTPHTIEPLAMSNQDDLGKLLHAKLTASGHVRPGDEADATRVLLAKSKVGLCPGQAVHNNFPGARTH
jgi:hypothetical protein